MVYSMILKNVSGQSYKSTIRIFGSSLVSTHYPLSAIQVCSKLLAVRVFEISSFLCSNLQRAITELCLPPFRVGRHIVFPGRPSVCLSQIVSALENRLSSIHETLYKYQSAWDDVQSARMVTLPFILFDLFPFWTLCITKIVSAL